MRSLVALSLLGCVAGAQTPPIRPTTPDVPAFQGFTVTKVPSTIGDEPLTADEAVKIAIANQPQLRAAFNQWLAAQARAQQARSDLLPQFALTYGASNQSVLQGQDNSTGGLGFRSNGAVTVSQLLFDFGRTRSFARQQGSLSRAAEWGYAGAVNDTSLAVRSSFYGLKRATQLEAVSESNLENRKSQLALADARLNSGFGAPADLLRAKNSLAEATIALTNARAATVSARILLALDLGVDPRTPITLVDSEEPQTPNDMDAMIGVALEKRPEMKEAKAAIDASGHGLNLARQTNAPVINLSASLAARGAEDPLVNQTSNVGITFSWPIGDGGLTAGRMKEARANLDTSRQSLRGLSQAIAGEVIQASVELQASEQRLATAEVQVANAKEMVRIAVGRYSGGIGTFTELTDAQDALFQADRNFTNAIADLQIARAALRRAIGEM